MIGASIETTPELWASSLRDVKKRIRPFAVPVHARGRPPTARGQVAATTDQEKSKPRGVVRLVDRKPEGNA
jgi:hypothetical protein